MTISFQWWENHNTQDYQDYIIIIKANRKAIFQKKMNQMVILKVSKAACFIHNCV